MNFKKRITKNLGASVLSQIITIVVQLSLIPLYLRFWGKESLGQWFIIQSFTNWLFISDLGLLGAHATEMTLLVSREKIRESTALFKSVSFTSAILFSITSSLFVLLASFSGFWRVLGIETTNQNLMWITLCLSLHTFLMQRTGLLHDVLRAHGNLSQGTLWNSFFRLAEFCVTGTLVILGKGMLAVAYSLVLTRLIGLVVMQSSVKKQHSWIASNIEPEFKLAKSLLKPSFSFLLFPLSDRIKYDGTSLVLGALFGPSVVSAFTTVRTLSNSVLQVGALFRSSVLPEFSIALARLEMEKAKKIFITCLTVSTFITLICSLLLFQYGAPLYAFWTHKQISFDPQLLQILLMAILLHGIWSNAAMPAISMNQLTRISVSLVISSALSLALGAVLSWSLSYYSFAVGFILTEMSLIPIAFKESFKVLEFETDDLYKAIVNPFKS